MKSVTGENRKVGNSNVPNRFLDSRSLEVVLDSGSWRIVSGFIFPEIEPVGGRRSRQAHNTEWHSHSSTDIMIVLGGRGVFGMERRLYPARKGTVFFIGHNREHHRFYPPRIKALWISVLGNSALSWVASLDHRGAAVNQTVPETFDASEAGINFGQCLAGLERSNLPEKLLRLKMLSFAESLAALAAERGFDNERDENTDDVHRNAVNAIMAHIKETGGSNVTLEGLTHISGYSKYHLHRLFKKHAGQTVGQYIDNCRREKEKTLRAEGYPRKIIADRLGFSGPQAYSRWSNRRGRRR